MPIYYFDVYDNERLRPDEFGLELENLYEARIQAIALLPHVAEDAIPDGDHHVFKVTVKCEDKRVRYVASLTLDGAWVDPPTYPEPTPDEKPIAAEASACGVDVSVPRFR